MPDQLSEGVCFLLSLLQNAETLVLKLLETVSCGHVAPLQFLFDPFQLVYDLHLGSLVLVLPYYVVEHILRELHPVHLFVRVLFDLSSNKLR